MPDPHSISLRGAAGAALALLAAATAACGIGPATNQDKIAKTTSTYLHALAHGDTATACAQLTRRAQGDHCRQAIEHRLTRLKRPALEDAADASLGITVHLRTATAALGKPNGAHLTLIKAGGDWRIASGYTLRPAAQPRPLA